MTEIARSPRLTPVTTGLANQLANQLAAGPLNSGRPAPPMTHEEALLVAFPAVDAGVIPFGSRVLVQIRVARNYHIGPSGHKFHIPDETRETEKWNTQVGKVIALGPLAFHSRQTQEPWPEGNWAEPGAYVRVPKYGGDRWEVPYGAAGEKAMFVIFNDLDLIGAVTGDPLAVKAFL